MARQVATYRFGPYELRTRDASIYSQLEITNGLRRPQQAVQFFSRDNIPGPDDQHLQNLVRLRTQSQLCPVLV
jgi:hypothetical protein